MTRHTIFKVLSLLLCAAIFTAPMGCATSPQHPHAGRSHVAYRVAVISVPTEPEVVLRKPWGKVKGTFIGIGRGALEALNDTLEGFDGSSGNDAEAVFIAMTVVYTIAGPIYMINGGIKGARESLPGAEIEETAAVIGQAIEDTGIQRLIRDKVAEKLFANGTVHTVTPIDDVPEGGYTSLRAFGFDTVLELSVQLTGLRGGDGADPPLAFFMNARARLIHIEDDTVLFDDVFTYENGQMTFGQWASNNAREFRNELGLAIEYISSHAVAEAVASYTNAASQDTLTAGAVSP
jgi:hypothetical protein